MTGTELVPVGAAAPDFDLPASDGERYRLSDVLSEAHVVLFFYPGNNTPG